MVGMVFLLAMGDSSPAVSNGNSLNLTTIHLDDKISPAACVSLDA